MDTWGDGGLKSHYLFLCDIFTWHDVLEVDPDVVVVEVTLLLVV